MTLRHHKTHSINTNDAPDHVKIAESRLCYINSVGAHGWCDTLSKLSEIFLDAQLKSRFTAETPQYTIIVPEYMLNKCKAHDDYISYDRIEFIINTFVPPDNGIIISVYTTPDDYDRSLFVPFWEKEAYNESSGVEWPFTTNVLWKLKDQNKPKTYVTWQKLGSTFQKERFPAFTHLEGHIQTILEEYDIPYKEVDYSMKPQTVYDIMSQSNLHISYVGATWWLAHYMGVPAIDYNLGRNYFGIIRAPGGAKDYAQMTWDQDINKFREIKHGSVASFQGNIHINDVKEKLLKHVSV